MIHVYFNSFTIYPYLTLFQTKMIENDLMRLEFLVSLHDGR